MASTPYGLGDRGEALYERYVCSDVAVNVLALEAARAADRLDELDSIIQGKGVLNLMQFRLDLPEKEDAPYTVEVKFQAVLAEARQQQSNLAGMLTRLAAMEGPKQIKQTEGEAMPKESWEESVGNVTPLQRARAGMSR